MSSKHEEIRKFCLDRAVDAHKHIDMGSNTVVETAGEFETYIREGAKDGK